MAYDDDDENLSGEAATVARVFRLRKEAARHQHDWRQNAREDYEFRDGKQWTQEDLSKLEEQRRPAVTFNRAAPIIDSVVGWEMGNRQEVRYFPRTMGDRRLNEVYTEAARWVRQNCDAEDEESDAFADAVVSGMGWTETRVDYDEEPDGKVVIERVSPLEMRWDSNARKANLADTMWMMREKWMDLEEARNRWPEYADKIQAGEGDMLTEPEFAEDHDASRAWQYESDTRWYDKRNKRVLVIQFQERVRESSYRVQRGEEMAEFTAERFERVREETPDEAYVHISRWTYQQCILVGKILVHEGPAPIEDGFSFHCITGKRDEEHGTWYGLMRAMKDPQRWANSFLSQAMYIFSSNAKGGLVVEEDAIDDKRMFEESWASPDAINWVNPGTIAGQKIWQKDLGGYPASLDKLLNFAIVSIRDVSGVNLELLGQANREQAGILEVERKKAALIILQPLINSLRRYRKMQGRALLSFMRKYIPPGTIMRLTDQYVPFYGDDSAIRYDIVVDTAPNAPNVKTEVWGQLAQMLPALVKAGVPIPPQLVRFSPLPESVAEEWISYMQNANSGPSPEIAKEMQRLQEENAKLTMENKQLSDKREMNAAELQHKREAAALEAQVRNQEMLLQAKAAEQELLWKSKISDADRAVKLLELNTKSETEAMKLREQSALCINELIFKNASESEKLKMQHEQKMETDVVPRIRELLEPIVEAQIKPLLQFAEQADQLNEMKPLVSLVERLLEMAAEAAERRRIVIEFLESQKGPVGEVAKRLN